MSDRNFFKTCGKAFQHFSDDDIAKKRKIKAKLQDNKLSRRKTWTIGLLSLTAVGLIAAYGVSGGLLDDNKNAVQIAQNSQNSNLNTQNNPENLDNLTTSSFSRNNLKGDIKLNDDTLEKLERAFNADNGEVNQTNDIKTDYLVRAFIKNNFLEKENGETYWLNPETGSYGTLKVINKSNENNCNVAEIKQDDINIANENEKVSVYSAMFCKDAKTDKWIMKSFENISKNQSQNLSSFTNSELDKNSSLSTSQKPQDDIMNIINSSTGFKNSKNSNNGLAMKQQNNHPLPRSRNLLR